MVRNFAEIVHGGGKAARRKSQKCAISKIVLNLADYGKNRLSGDGPVRTCILGEPIVHRTAEFHYASYSSFGDTAVQIWKRIEPEIG